MSSRRSLLETVRGLLERTYRMRTGLLELAPFIIGDRGYRLLYGSTAPLQVAGDGAGQGARTLIRQTRRGLLACVYFPDRMIRRLEEFPPQRGLGRANVDAFATFVEEIDHLLLVAERSREQREVSLFELELHANVSKHLVLARFLAAGARKLGPEQRVWLRHSLFTSRRYVEDDPRVRSRYRDAARYAVRLLDRLADRSAESRIGILRRFHAAGPQGKIALIERLAA